MSARPCKRLATPGKEKTKAISIKLNFSLTFKNENVKVKGMKDKLCELLSR